MGNQIKVCENCGKEFSTSRSDTKFCGNICRASFSRLNKLGGVTLDSGKVSSSNQPSQVELMAQILDELQTIKTIIANQGERVLTVEGTCKELDISKPTFERLQAEGLLKLHRFGGKETKGRGRKPYILFSELVDTLRINVVSKVEQNRLSDGKG